MKSQPIFYDVEFYAQKKGFEPPKQKHGLRKVSKLKVISSTLIFSLSFLLLLIYLYSYSSGVSMSVNGQQTVDKGDPIGLLGTSIFGAVMALPFAILVLWTTRRYFIQPIFTYVAPFFYGATWAVGLSLLLSLFVDTLYGGIIEKTGADPLSFFATVHAPVSEEFFKGLGLLFMFWMFKDYFRTVHDGVIYGMLIGIGFAFSENIQYFIQHGTTSEGFWTLVITRVLASFLAHASFTAATGLVMGWFLTRSGGKLFPTVGGWSVGLLLALSGHAIWNGSASVSFFIPSYVFVFLPVFILISFLMASAGKNYDSKYINTLNRYRDQGWLLESTYVDMFPKASRKKTIRKLSRKERKHARFVASSLSELAQIRWVLDTYSGARRFQNREKELLIALFLEQRKEINNNCQNKNQ